MVDDSIRTWRVKQYCYFWIASQTMTADQVTEMVGIEPDRVTVCGSKSTAPRVVPVEHSWALVCDRQGPIDEQVTDVLNRIEPAATIVRSLVDEGQVQAGLMMIRYFGDADGGYDAMGWSLTPEQIALLAAIGADIQSDEYLDNAEPSSYEAVGPTHRS